MKLKNNFTNYTRSLFMYNNACWECGRNQNLELHHIYGRVSASPFNCAPMCHTCHMAVTQDFEHRKKYFKKTFVYLQENTGHQITEEDEEFFKKMGDELVKIYPQLSTLVKETH